MIVNLKKEKCDIYIGRCKSSSLHYGNPFHVGPNGTLKEVVDKYELWLRGCMFTDIEQNRRQWILGTLHVLQGKRLGIYGDPKLSHGNVLMKLIEEQTYKYSESLSFGEIQWKF